MNIDKSGSAKLKEERGIFLLMSFILSLSVLYVVLEWSDTGFSEDDHYGDLEPFSKDELSVFLLESPIEMNFPEPEIFGEPVEEEVIKKDFEIVDFLPEEPDSLPPLSVKELMEQSMSVEDRAEDFEWAQEELLEELLPVTDIDVLPEFPGGQAALIRYIYNHVKYPEVAVKQKIQGRVVCSFIIGEDGTVSEIKLEESVYIFLDEEAIRVLEGMPAWNPGMKSGLPVRVKYVLPVFFRL